MGIKVDKALKYVEIQEKYVEIQEKHHKSLF